METGAAHREGGSRVAYGFEIDPCAVLGVSDEAPLQEVRRAYLAKLEKYHPDRGGDDWAYRVVARCYEILSTARVVGHVAQEGDPSADRPGRPEVSEGRTRPGVRDPWVDAARLVDVEVFVVRFDLTTPIELAAVPREERNLCCCLHVTWTVPPAPAAEEGAPDGPTDLQLLVEAFQATASRAQSQASWSRVEGGRFEGWLNYTTAVRAWEGFRLFHEALNGRGLGVNQWSREIVIPKAEP